MFSDIINCCLIKCHVCLFCCHPGRMYNFRQVRFGVLAIFKSTKYCSFHANHHFNHSLNKFSSLFSVINGSRFVTAVLNCISVCAANMLHVKFLNFSRSSEFVNIESFILRFTLCLKWNSHEMHLSIKSKPKTLLNGIPVRTFFIKYQTCWIEQIKFFRTTA